MQRSIEIPKALIYEEFDGHPVYRKGYRDYLVGTKTVEEIMGTSKLQWFIVIALLRKILQLFPAGQYHVGTNEPGLHVHKGTNLSSDIVIYEIDEIEIRLDSLHYADVPPHVVIEVDVKADYNDLFDSELSYIRRKTEILLDFGVQKVIWITSSNQQVMITSVGKPMEIVSWEVPIEIMDGKSVNTWQLMLDNGLKL